MTISLSTISSVFSPLTSSTAGQSFLLSLDSKDPVIDQTLALGQALSNALGDAQIKSVQGSSYLAANTAVERIKAQVAAKQKESAAKQQAALATLAAFNKVDKTA
jgi:hypothetical protein